MSEGDTYTLHIYLRLFWLPFVIAVSLVFLLTDFHCFPLEKLENTKGVK